MLIPLDLVKILIAYINIPINIKLNHISINEKNIACAGVKYLIIDAEIPTVVYRILRLTIIPEVPAFPSTSPHVVPHCIY